MNVVTFIFISGGLLLNKQESEREWFKKRILRIVLVIIIFSLVYYPFTDMVIKGNNLLDTIMRNIFPFFRTVFSIHITNAYWYLYLYLGLMLLLPCLRVFAQNAGQFQFAILFVLFLLVQSIYPILVHYCGFPEFHSVFSQLFSYCAGWIVIFLFGFYYEKYISISFSVLKVCLLSALYLIGNWIPTGITYYEFFIKEDRSLFLDNPFLLWSIIATVSLIIMIDLICRKMENKCSNIKKIIGKLAPLTFGIYLLSDIFLIVLKPHFDGVIEKNAIVGILLLDVSVFALGTVITLLLRKIPGLKKIL